jgi:pimeloyl-ACP methyl ester carboxylesterase
MPFVTVGGYDIYFADDDFSDPWASPRTVFMQHYIHGSSADFRAWVPTLSRHARVIRMDRLGNGRSQRPASHHRFTVDNILAGMAEFLDILGIGAVHYVGESLGGCLGALFTAKYPDRVRTLTLSSTPLSISREFQRKYFIPAGYPDAPTAVREMGAWRYFHTALRAVYTYSPDDPDAAFRDQLRSELRYGLSTRVVADLLDVVTDPGFTIREVLPAIKVPTLLLSGRLSHSAPPPDQSYLKQHLSQAEQAEYGCAEPAWEMPDEAAATTLNFILRHSAPRRAGG